MSRFNSQTYIPQLAIDCVIFGYKDKELKVLVSKLYLKGDIYSLPNGFIFQHEGIDEAAQRILKERTGISNIFLAHYKNFGQAERSNRVLLENILEQNREHFAGEIKLTQEEIDWLSNRFISLGYYALVDINKVTPTKSDLDESMEWYSIHVDVRDLTPIALHTKGNRLKCGMTSSSTTWSCFLVNCCFVTLPSCLNQTGQVHQSSSDLFTLS